MNQKLQNILDIIQQSERLDSEQKDNLLKAVNDADKELEITAFKLERTEKVKKTTAILLEETIEELEQKRKAVEAQNRELEIEASLERVRAIAMGMDKSDDLLAVCEIFFKEFTKLGFNALRNGLINIFNDEQKFLVNYDYSDYMGGSISNVSYNSNPANDEFLINIRKANDAFVETIIDRDQLDEWKEFRRSHGESDDPRLDNINALYYYNYSFGSGSIGISNFEPISEEQQIILKRFRNVFNLSYQRYSDIALAEAQTREAQIEASLERVRAVSMAMHKPEDLLNVSKIQFKEFKKLGFSDIRNALIAIFNDEEEYFLDHDYSDDTGGNINKVPYNSHPEIDKLLTQSRKANDAFVELVIDKDQLDRWKEFRRSHGEEDDPRLSNIDALYYYNYSIGIGVVGFSTTKPIGEEYLKVLKRFRNVFDLAYRRYIDIAQAEAQAREAQIEASLEKVRAVAMSMNRSEDLLSICEVSFKEFKKLGFDNIRNALIHIQYDEQKYFMDYDFSDLTGGAITKLEYGSHPVVEDYLQQIRSAKDAFYQGVIKEDQLEEWKDFRRNSGQIDDPRLKKSTALYYYFFSIGIGDIGISTLQPINEYQIKILKRFRNVFDLAYRRYTDITKAEAQAREAQIEAALERVRTNAMAMQSSNDFAKIVEIVFTELKKVGFETLRCGIGIIESAETKKVDIWSTTLADEDLSIQISGDEVLEGHALLDGIIEHWINQTEFSYVLEGEDFLKYYKTVEKTNFHLPDYAQQNLSSDEKQYYYMVPCKAGGIYAFSTVPFTDEVKKLMRRFIEVFQLTYTRYIDLQKAEEQTREAIKQASLDRVRGEIASMRTSEDLNKITPIIWRELKNLEVPFFRCGVFIVDEDQQRTQVYLTTPDGKSLGVLNLQFGSNELADNIVEQWKKNQVYKEHWNKEKFISWTKSMMELGQVQNPETYQGSVNPPESLDLHFVPFTQGMLYVGDVSPLTDEKLQLVKTLGEAFSIAYARYEDFKHLEEAKNKIELTLTELKSAQTQLVHSEKMASLGELTAGIAHEIKNPLNFVNNFSEVSRELLDEMKIELEKNNIQEVIEIVSDLKQNLEKINLHGKRADSIVKGMLLHSRGSSGEKTLTDINELLDQYVNLAFHGMRAQNKEFNITIEKDYDNSLGKVNVIPQDISRVFLNIINNACYAAFDRKKQSKNDFNPVLYVSTNNQKNKVEIKIGDNGNGIPANLTDKIFQPFFTTKPSGEGTGLGLSLSYDIVKAHGGELKVKTTDGEGTVFTIDLPVRI